MALGNTPRVETNFYVEPNKSYAFGISFQDIDHDPIDLDGAIIRMVIANDAYRGGGEILEKTALLIVPDQGLCQFQFQAAELDLQDGQYVYDITFTATSGYSTPILKGYFEVGTNVDYNSSNTYVDVNTGSEITVVMDNIDVVQITVEKIDGMFHIITELIEDFREQMSSGLQYIAESRTAAVNAASAANADANELRAMIATVGYPFWKVLTQDQYNALPEIGNGILYVIVDPGMVP